MLGDKVIVKGERLGCVTYIGKLDFDIFDQIYIGVSLDMPGKCHLIRSGGLAAHNSSPCAMQLGTLMVC
jgi:hypothetical protein